MCIYDAVADTNIHFGWELLEIVGLGNKIIDETYIKYTFPVYQFFDDPRDCKKLITDNFFLASRPCGTFYKNNFFRKTKTVKF